MLDRHVTEILFAAGHDDNRNVPCVRLSVNLLAYNVTVDHREREIEHDKIRRVESMARSAERPSLASVTSKPAARRAVR